MRESQNIKNRFLGIVFAIFTIVIGVFALNEFKNQSPNISGNLGGKILTKFKKDSIFIKYFEETKKTKINKLSLTTSIQKANVQKDSMISKVLDNF